MHRSPPLRPSCLTSTSTETHLQGISAQATAVVLHLSLPQAVVIAFHILVRDNGTNMLAVFHGGVCDLSFPAHALLPVQQQWQHAGRIRFLLWTMISAAANDSPAPSAGEHTAGMKGHKIRRAETGNSGFGVDIRRVKRSLGESNSPDI